MVYDGKYICRRPSNIGTNTHVRKHCAKQRHTRVTWEASSDAVKKEKWRPETLLSNADDENSYRTRRNNFIPMEREEVSLMKVANTCLPSDLSACCVYHFFGCRGKRRDPRRPCLCLEIQLIGERWPSATCFRYRLPGDAKQVTIKASIIESAFTRRNPYKPSRSLLTVEKCKLGESSRSESMTGAKFAR